MIRKRISDETVAVTPEESDDLLALRRVVSAGDRIVSDTTRVTKIDREYSRPDSGKRVKIRIALDVEGVSLDSQLDRLRIRGVIAESNNELVSRGSYHSVVVKPGDRLTLTKRSWSGLHRRLLTGHDAPGFVLVAIDVSECGVGRLKGTHLRMIPDIRSGYSGKRYRHAFRVEKFLAEVKDLLLGVAEKSDTIVLFGPGQTKNKLAGFLRSSMGEYKIVLAEGIDAAGQDGLYAFTRSDVMRETMAESKLAQVSSIIDDIMAMVGRGSHRFAMGVTDTRRAVRLGAVKALIFSGRVLKEADEDAVVELINDAQSQGATTYSVDSSTDVGLRVDGLGSIVALLRFELKV